MKKSYKLFIIATLAIFSSCCNITENNEVKTPNELKVMTWNIWHKGHSAAFPEVGCEGTLGILKKSDADVILMVETYGSSADVADELGYYHRLISSNLSVYSKYPITKTYTFADTISTFNFGGVEIDMEGTKVRLFDVWLHYMPDASAIPTDKTEAEILAWDDAGKRDDEIRTILSVIKTFIAEADSIPLIVGGDFNSHSHLDWIESTKDMYNHGGKVVKWSVSSEMENAGFKDSFREINVDPTKNIGTTWFGNKREDRIDYIYYKGAAIKAVESESYNKKLGEILSFKGEDFFYASDHGFVLTTFKVGSEK